MSFSVEDGVFALGDLAVERGGTIADARVRWKSYGTLSAARDNVIVYPTSYTATADAQEWLIGPEGILDPTRWFIVIPDMFGSGTSSSPSNTADYPALVTAGDNVRAQARLLRERFGVERVACAYGFSMGAIQAYHWAALFPERVERAVVVCGSARTSVHNQVFLQGLLAILEAAPEHLGDGRFSSEPVAAVRAFARVYAGWAMSQDWYREGLYLSGEVTDLQAFLDREWEPGFTACTAGNLYAQARCWEAADIGASYGGDLTRALAAIEARVLLLPGETDLYFRVADNAAELAHLRHGELRPIPSIWGHRAGWPQGIAADEAFVKEAVRNWLG